MRDVTLCFLVRAGEICLAMKKRGFGVGKWNGVGGKLQEGETLEEGAVRETAEEIGVRVRKEDLEKMGAIDFSFTNKPEWSQRVHIFFIRHWEGEPRESEEMRPQWHKTSELPLKEMWPADLHWLPRVVAGEKIQGKVHFNNDGSAIEKFEVRPMK